MTKQSIDFSELAKKFNQLRQDNLNKKFTATDMRELMKSIGISASVFHLMGKDSQYFRTRTIGRNREYCFQQFPTHWNLFSRLYSQCSKNRKEYNSKLKENTTLTEQSAIELLKSLGYILYKDEGLNEDLLKSKYPEIYKEVKQLVKV